jgi:hypothetical protein
VQWLPPCCRSVVGGALRDLPRYRQVSRSFYRDEPACRPVRDRQPQHRHAACIPLDSQAIRAVPPARKTWRRDYRSHDPAFVDRACSYPETETVAVRLRLYPCSAGVSHAPILIDRFPAVLSAPHDWPDLGPHDCGLSRWCLLEVRSGAVFLVDQTPEAVTFRNGIRLPIEQQKRTPLVPGDRLRIDESEFIVSYEQVTRSRTDLHQRRKLRPIDRPQKREPVVAGR